MHTFLVLAKQTICDDLLADIGAWCDQYCATCDIIFAGDFNVNRDSTDHVSTAINSFLAKYSRTWYVAMFCFHLLKYQRIYMRP